MREQAKRIFVAAITVSIFCASMSMDSAFAVDGGAQAVNFINQAAKIATTVAGALGILFAILGGIYYVTSNGKFDRAEKAKATLIHVGIGLVIVFAASVLVSVVTDMAKSSFGS